MEIQEIDTFKKNSINYPMDRGSQFFELIVPQNKKDLINNQAFQYANDELNKLKEIVLVAQKQALEIKKRVEITVLINDAVFNFTPKVNENYWLINNKETDKNILSVLGPSDWSFGPPTYYNFLYKVKYLANGLWDIVD
jgi:hypothetical protein